MQTKISRTLEGLIARTAFDAAKQGATRWLKDRLLLEMLREEGSLAYQLLSTRLKDWELYQVALRLERDIALNNNAPADNPEEFYIRFAEELRNRFRSANSISTAHALLAIISDGQTLGIILTPRHITDLMCDLVDVQVDDVVLDPTCGTAGFLISAMHRMVRQANGNTTLERNIKKKQLHGFEIQPNMFVIAAANMILRKDGNANLRQEDFLKQEAGMVQLKGATVGLMNPPYSQGSKADPEQYELSFVEHLLDCLAPGARCAVIVPQSSMTGKTKAEQNFKTEILRHHTLEGVITCNTNTFYGVGTNPVIAVFTAHEPHPEDHMAKFIDFRDDGYEVRPHIGLLEGDSAKDKRQHLLDVWNGKAEAPSRFCVQSTVEASDEWLHSFYYFNDEIPTDADFEKSIGDYLTFEFGMVMQNREYLFDQKEADNEAK